MKKTLTGTVEKNEIIAAGVYSMTIKSSLKKVCPGQFISILIPNKTLRRPFSVAGFEDDIVTVMYKLKGDGTKYLSSLKKSDSVDFLAPLGNTFDVKNYKKPLLIGAGIGIAPMLFLKSTLENAYLISGFKSKDEVIFGSDKTVIGGSVLDNIEDVIASYKPDLICSCGPKIVLKTVSEIGMKHNIDTQVAMEKTMACGIGVCKGCMIELKTGNATVCKDGPVFKGEDVVW